MLTIRAVRISVEDRLRHSLLVRRVVAGWTLHRASRRRASAPRQLVQVIQQLCSAARVAQTAEQIRRAEALVHERAARLRRMQPDWPPPDSDSIARPLAKSLVLKSRVSAREPGVLFVSFEYNWLRLLALPNLESFAREYTLVLAPSWSPPHGLVSSVFPAYYPEPVLTLISNEHDLDHFPRLSPRYVVVPLLASHWVNPDLFRPRAFAEKDVDVVMVANWGRFKRHHALFEALRELPRDLRVWLIGQPQDGRTAQTIRAEAAAYGVAGRFEVTENMSHPQVREALSRARISLVLSRREGSCVAVAESLFAGTPVGLYGDAGIGSRMFINPQTGRLLRHSGLAGQIMAFLGEARGCNPREWALANGIDCRSSSRRLNEALRRHAETRGQEWTRDIVPLQWAPDPEHLERDSLARMEDAYEDIRSRFGLAIGGTASAGGSARP